MSFLVHANDSPFSVPQICQKHYHVLLTVNTLAYKYGGLICFGMEVYFDFFSRRRSIPAEVHLGRSSVQENVVISESRPLLEHHSSRSYDQSYRSCDQSHDGDKKSKNRVSLTLVLWKTFGWDFFVSNIWKLIYDVLLFVNPFLLQ